MDAPSVEKAESPASPDRVTSQRHRTPFQRFARRIANDLWDRPDQNFAPLDGLRGFASCIVVFYHCALFTGFLHHGSPQARNAPWLGVLSNGFWSGIDIFFVLSGFLIGRILLRELNDGGRIRYKSFFIRRSFRIFPAYYLVLTLSLFVIAPLDVPVFRFLFLTGSWSELLGSAWANYLYLVNYVRPGNMASPMSWAWSLCVEEHFYFLLPGILFLLHRAGGEAVRLGGLVCCVAAPFVGRAAQFAADPSLRLMDGFYYYSHNRFDEIFVGVLISYLFVNHQARLVSFTRVTGPWLYAVGLACVAAVWWFGGLQRDGQFAVVWQFLVMAIGTGLVVVNCLFVDNRVTRIFAHPLWYPLARVSYGTYLIHPFVLFALLAWYVRTASLDQLTGISLIGIYLAVMIASTVLAAAMFVLLESPLLRKGMALSARYGAGAPANVAPLEAAAP